MSARDIRSSDVDDCELGARGGKQSGNVGSVAGDHVCLSADGQAPRRPHHSRPSFATFRAAPPPHARLPRRKRRPRNPEQAPQLHLIGARLTCATTGVGTSGTWPVSRRTRCSAQTRRSPRSAATRPRHTRRVSPSDAPRVFPRRQAMSCRRELLEVSGPCSSSHSATAARPSRMRNAWRAAAVIHAETLTLLLRNPGSPRNGRRRPR